MKRKLSSTAVAAPSATRRRQPQISCDFCRSKKLKCDRGRPCLNCSVRKLPCDGPPEDFNTGACQHSPNIPGNELLDRLHRLEQAVFGSERLVDGTNASSHGMEHRSNHHRDTIQPKPLAPSQLMGNTGAKSNSSVVLDHGQDLTFWVYPEPLLSAQHLALLSSCTQGSEGGSRVVQLPKREDALSLFDEYIENANYLLRVVHAPTARQTIIDTYNRLSQGQQVGLGVAALILSICASSAFLWNDRGPSMLKFKSAEEAAHQSFVWRKATLDILDQSSRSTAKSLEAIQASMILAEQIYSLEGLSTTYHYLHSCSINAARQMSVHLVDAPNQPDQGDLITREYKRRIWWYLASTDWLLGIMNGPLDRTYMINPKHMIVKCPRHLNDEDVATFAEDEARPDTEPTEMSIFIQRIRLADTCRRIVDGLPLGMGEIDGLPYEQVEALDQLFERDLTNLLPALNHPNPLPPEAPPRFAFQKQTILLAYHARRARLLRPYLRPGPALHEPLRDKLRATCLRSAHAVLQTASAVLQDCLGEPTIVTTPDGSIVQKQPSSHRNGCIINHLFMSCIVLATDPTLSLDASSARDAEAETRRSELTSTIHLLEKVGKDSVMVTNMLRDLTGMLRRPRNQGVETVVGAVPCEVEQPAPTSPSLKEARNPAASLSERNIDPVQNGSLDINLAMDARPEWNLAEADSIDLNEIWDEFIGNIPNEEGWDQLFADLDTFPVPI